MQIFNLFFVGGKPSAVEKTTVRTEKKKTKSEPDAFKLHIVPSGVKQVTDSLRANRQYK